MTLEQVTYCPEAGKLQSFRSRSQARKAVRLRYTDSGGRRMDAYQCGDHWHIGPSSLGPIVPCRTCQAPITVGFDQTRGIVAPLDPDTGQGHHCHYRRASA